MDRPIKIQEKELTIINQNNDVSFIFNPDYYRKLLDNNCLFDVESVVYNIIRDEILKYPYNSFHIKDMPLILLCLNHRNHQLLQ